MEMFNYLSDVSTWMSHRPLKFNLIQTGLLLSPRPVPLLVWCQGRTILQPARKPDTQEARCCSPSRSTFSSDPPPKCVESSIPMAPEIYCSLPTVVSAFLNNFLSFGNCLLVSLYRFWLSPIHFPNFSTTTKSSDSFLCTSNQI